MNVPGSLLRIFQTIAPVPDELLPELLEKIRPLSLKKKEVWLQQGEVCDRVMFIDEGFLYVTVEKEGESVVTWFLRENDFMVSVKSFFRQIPSEETIVALEATKGFCISYADLHELLDKHPLMLKIYSRMLEGYFILSEDRAINLRTKDAYARYQFLLEHHPEIIQRAPQKLIASYLNLSVETLSRLRAKMMG